MIRFWRNSIGNSLFFAQFSFENFRCVFSRSNTIGHISGMVGQIDVERKGGASVGYWVNYRNWYQDWGHCGVTNDLGSSPQPEGCDELPRWLVTPQWPKSRYQFLFYHDASKHVEFMQIRVCISRKSLIKLLQISHFGKHGHRPLP